MPQVMQDIYLFKTFDDVIEVLNTVCIGHPRLRSAELGLSELMLNAIEHGNLEITFEEKTDALENGAIIDIVDARLRMDAYKNRHARMEVLDYADETVVIISDEGPGFDWKGFLNRDIVEVTGLHGRGMLMSEQIFKTMVYIGNGNKVVAVVDGDGKDPGPSSGGTLDGEDESIVDVDRFTMLLNDFDDEQIIGQLLAQFARSVERLHVHIADHLLVGNMDEVYHAAHTLKGACANIGATDMARISLQIEAASQRRDADAANQLLHDSHEAFASTRRAFDRLSLAKGKPVLP